MIVAIKAGIKSRVLSRFIACLPFLDQLYDTANVPEALRYWPWGPLGIGASAWPYRLRPKYRATATSRTIKTGKTDRWFIGKSDPTHMPSRGNSREIGFSIEMLHAVT